jgi:RNA polymerase sporulation-specific sigma factor
MDDEDLVVRARAGSKPAAEHLLSKYRGLVEGKARTYYLVGGEHDDVVQEGMIGLYKAIRDFSSDRLSAFRSFAELCVTRQMITAIKTATRHKHKLFNHCLSLDRPLPGEGEQLDLHESIVDSWAQNPEEAILSRSFCRQVLGQVHTVLSDFEAQVLARYLEGLSYRGISEELGCGTKQVDNALQRAKRKLSEAIGLQTERQAGRRPA